MGLRQWPVLALIAHFFLCPAARAQDHLEPEEGAFSKPQDESDYHNRVRDVLLKDPASDHIARMICLPSFKPEWVVTVAEESDPDDDRSRPRITSNTSSPSGNCFLGGQTSTAASAAISRAARSRHGQGFKRCVAENAPQNTLSRRTAGRLRRGRLSLLAFRPTREPRPERPARRF